MPPKRKRPASRPPEETTTSGPPARRAKTLAKDSISLQLTTEQDDRPTLTPSPSNDLDDDFASLEPKVEKQEPPEEPMDYSGGSNPDVCAICLAPWTVSWHKAFKSGSFVLEVCVTLSVLLLSVEPLALLTVREPEESRKR
ncbi:hypothetical protein COOONC_13647 [Cooperia oncophora]